MLALLHEMNTDIHTELKSHAFDNVFRKGLTLETVITDEGHKTVLCVCLCVCVCVCVCVCDLTNSIKALKVQKTPIPHSTGVSVTV